MRRSVAQARARRRLGASLSSTFHPGLVRSLSRPATIDGMQLRMPLVASVAWLTGVSVLLPACGGSPGAQVADLHPAAATTNERKALGLP
jgi:hypothetical protein